MARGAGPALSIRREICIRRKIQGRLAEGYGETGSDNRKHNGNHAEVCVAYDIGESFAAVL